MANGQPYCATASAQQSISAQTTVQHRDDGYAAQYSFVVEAICSQVGGVGAAEKDDDESPHIRSSLPGACPLPGWRTQDWSFSSALIPAQCYKNQRGYTVADCCFFSRVAQPETPFSFSGQGLVALAITAYGGPVSR